MREEGLSQKQVEAIKWAEETVAKVNNDQRAFVKCKESRPITDLKNMLETSAELFANNVAFLQKYSHKDPYTEIKYSQVMEDVNGLGSALVARGLKGKRVAVIGENCYQWAVSYLAVACGTGIVVPLDRELNAEELKNQIIRAEVSGVLFAKKHETVFKQIKEDGDTPLQVLVNFNTDEETNGVCSFSQLIEEGKKDRIQKRRQRIR